MLNAERSEKRRKERRNLKFVLPGPFSAWWFQLYQKRLCGWITVMVVSVPHAPRLTPATARGHISQASLSYSDLRAKSISLPFPTLGLLIPSRHPTSTTRNKWSRPTEPPPTNSSTWSQRQNFKFLPWRAPRATDSIGCISADIDVVASDVVILFIIAQGLLRAAHDTRVGTTSNCK